MDYSKEPEVVFSPLSEPDYCRFYDLEMASFTDDATLYLSFIDQRDTVLELGCGSGRLTHKFAAHCKSVTGIDISASMIHRAQKQARPNEAFHVMDMSQFSLDQLFDAIVIPYNTLNLLGNSQNVSKCLQCCREHMTINGNLFLQLYNPNDDLKRQAGTRLFQFTFLPKENPNQTIIKETLRVYDASCQTMTMEERYRVRITNQPENSRDLNHTYSLYVPSFETWKELLTLSGFTLIASWGDYDKRAFSEKNDNTLLIHAETTL